MVLLCLFCCIIYFSVHQYQLVRIYLSVGLNHQLPLFSGCSKSSICLVIRSNIAFSFMLHCMNLVDSIFWICLLVPYLVMCGFIFPRLCLVKLCFSEMK